VKIDGVFGVTTVEAQAVRDILRLAERTGCNHIDIEIDSLEVVNAFLYRMENRTVGRVFYRGKSTDHCRAQFG
jgi:hypothetical protein